MNEEHARRAQARADKISDATNYERLGEYAQEALKSPLLAHRVFWLHRLADEVGKATKGLVACDNGCSHCCHQPVLISYTEARYIGRQERISPKFAKHAPIANPSYIGKPCVFLEDGKCSIYDNRPFVCRVYYSLDDDPEACRIIDPKNLGIVAKMDPSQFHAIEFKALEDAVEHVADIRDFFTKGAK